MPEQPGDADIDLDLERDLDLDLDDDEDEADLDSPEMGVAFSPRQILGGFALLAAILVWLFRRRSKGG